MESNKVKVRIYGQEYTVAGEKDEQTIRDIADYVNEKMRLLGRSFSTNGQGTLAVLAAINIAEEYFDATSKEAELAEANEKLSKDVEHYIQLWEESKKSFIHYKENASKLSEEKSDWEQKHQELAERCKDFESSFFELQAENLRLQNELARYKELNES